METQIIWLVAIQRKLPYMLLASLVNHKKICCQRSPLLQFLYPNSLTINCIVLKLSQIMHKFQEPSASIECKYFKLKIMCFVQSTHMQLVHFRGAYEVAVLSDVCERFDDLFVNYIWSMVGTHICKLCSNIFVFAWKNCFCHKMLHFIL